MTSLEDLIKAVREEIDSLHKIQGDTSQELVASTSFNDRVFLQDLLDDIDNQLRLANRNLVFLMTKQPNVIDAIANLKSAVDHSKQVAKEIKQATDRIDALYKAVEASTKLIKELSKFAASVAP